MGYNTRTASLKPKKASNSVLSVLKTDSWGEGGVWVFCAVLLYEAPGNHRIPVRSAESCKNN